MASTRVKRARTSASGKKRTSSRRGARAAAPRRKAAVPRTRSAARRNGAGTLKRGTIAKARPSKARPSKARATKRAAKPRRASRAAPREAGVPPPVTNGVGLLNYHIDYTSQDLEGVKRFYTEGLGFRNFHHDPSANYLMVRTTPTSSIGFMPPMPGPPEEWRPPREPALYLMVDDVDRAYRDLSARGVVFEQAPQDMPWMHRVALLRDPEGRRVCLAQVLNR